MKNQSATVSTANEELAKQAQNQYTVGRFKEAIELYKKLLKNTTNEQWRQSLADCYLQRALAFVQKGMIKEALVLWKNYHQQSQPPYQAYDLFLVCLIQTSKSSEVKSYLTQITADQLDQEYPLLAGWLGLLMISEHPEYQQYLPQDSALIMHLQIVQKALQLFQANKLQDAEQTLKALPYRSAFRDFKTVLKAVLCFPVSRQSAQPLLTRIAENSLYFPIARILHVCTLSGSALALAMKPLSHNQRKIVGKVIGLDKKQNRLIELLVKQKTPLSNKVQFNLTVQFQSLCGPELAQRFCQSLLINYPPGRREFNQKFTVISDFEENRLKALRCEQDGMNYDADFYWQRCIEGLSSEAGENGLKIALILRHMTKGKLKNESLPLLVESLDYDPDDRDTYLKIIDYYRAESQFSKEYRYWLDKTLKRFPQDVEVLTQIVHASTRNQAFKKASQYAAKILKIDPVNTFARKVLFFSHLSHAKRLFRTQKYHLVDKELQLAEKIRIGKIHLPQTELIRGFLCFAQDDKKQGLQQINAALQKLNSDPVNARFQAIMESQLTAQPTTTILRALPQIKDCELTETALSRFVELLKFYNENKSHQDLIHKALAKVKTSLKNSLKQRDYPESLLLELCQALDDCQHFELLRHVATIASKKWKKPIWVYFQVYSETKGDPLTCSNLQCIRLQTSLINSGDDDHRAIRLISQYLKRNQSQYASPGMGITDEISAEDEYDDAPWKELFCHIPEDIFVRMNKRAVALMNKISPEKLIKKLPIAKNDASKVLMAMMQNPDMFPALLLLYAADDLKIATGIHIEDVLACFDIDKKSDSSFPFPF